MRFGILARGEATLTDPATSVAATALTAKAIRRCADVGGHAVLMPAFAAAASPAAMDCFVAAGASSCRPRLIAE